VKAGRRATITRIGGGYSVYFKTGKGWNSRVHQFSSNCSFQKFDQPFGRNESWQIGLQPTTFGNASTSDVDAYEDNLIHCPISGSGFGCSSTATEA
jgi:hypothetical protein